MKPGIQKSAILWGFLLLMGLVGRSPIAHAIENEQVDCPANDDRTIDRPLVDPSVVPPKADAASGKASDAKKAD